MNVGVAAHITAAAKGGPRYDESITREERRAATNAIWLCHTCARLIDSDPFSFSANELQRWKHEAEAEADANIGKPASAAVTSSHSELARRSLMDQRFKMILEDYRHRGTPKYMIDTFTDFSPEEKAMLYDKAVLWERGRVSKNNPYIL